MARFDDDPHLTVYCEELTSPTALIVGAGIGGLSAGLALRQVGWTIRIVATADLLVGADGVRSKVRRPLHPDEPPPRSSGIVAIRGAVHGVVHHLGDLSAVYFLGRGVEAVIVRASDTGIYWFVSLAAELVPAGMRDPAAVLAE